MIDTRITQDKNELGRQAAALGAEAIRAAIARHGEATIIVATGASQFEMLQNLVVAEGIDWSKVTAFHLDEYVGLPESHPASFRGYLKERFLSPLPVKPASVRTAISPSTIRRPISTLTSPISSSRSTRPAASSNTARAGSRALKRCRNRRSR